MFQSTLPHGERLCLKFIVTLPIVVSIHAPARGATNYITGLDFNSRCFNPRSRTGSDPGIRTHYKSLPLFQSTLPHGERRGDERYRCRYYRFQSTLPHGERLASKLLSRYGYNVSIHAPARGATISFRLSRPWPYRFNPRSRTGSDMRYIRHRRLTMSFQSTLPHGERPGRQSE